jgi:hypothetical protein
LLLTLKSNAVGRQKSIAWKQLSDLELCLLSSDMQNRRILQRNFTEAGITVVPKLESDTVSVLYDHVSAHGWSTVITDAWLQVRGVPEGMCAVPMDSPRHSFDVGIVLADREPVPLLATALVDAAQRVSFPGPSRRSDS